MTKKPPTFSPPESVSEGHPDKICDQISDAVLDAVMAADPSGRVACETSVTTGLVLVFGEISTTAHLDVPKIARETIKGIGYDNPAYGFDGDSCSVLVAIDEQFHGHRPRALERHWKFAVAKTPTSRPAPAIRA